MAERVALVACMTAYVWSTPSRDLVACRLARNVKTPIITMIAAPPYVATIRCRLVSFGVERLPISCLFGLSHIRPRIPQTTSAREVLLATVPDGRSEAPTAHSYVLLSSSLGHPT